MACHVFHLRTFWPGRGLVHLAGWCWEGWEGKGGPGDWGRWWVGEWEREGERDTPYWWWPAPGGGARCKHGLVAVDRLTGAGWGVGRHGEAWQGVAWQDKAHVRQGYLVDVTWRRGGGRVRVVRGDVRRVAGVRPPGREQVVRVLRVRGVVRRVHHLTNLGQCMCKTKVQGYKYYYGTSLDTVVIGHLLLFLLVDIVG